MQKVSVIIPGAGKCATTTLFALLKRHPQLCASRMKETNFFSKEAAWQKGLDWYHALYHPTDGQILFESSPSYAKMQLSGMHILERIHDYNPRMKFIYMVRDPKARAISSYLHGYQRFYTNTDLHTDLYRNPKYITVSRYFTFCETVTRIFGRDHLLIVDFDDFVRDQQSTLYRIAEFLHIDPTPFAQMDTLHQNTASSNAKYNHKWNKGWRLKIKSISPRLWRLLSRMQRRKIKSRPTLTSEDQGFIIDALSDEIDRLELLMGKSLQHWKKVTSS